MSDLEVPGGLTPKPIVAGDDLIFAFRASDGTPISFTASQLLAALGLKTINYESIRGSGNITVGSNETAASIIQKLSANPNNNTAILPTAKLNPAQFTQPVSGGYINHDENWLIQFGAAQGWGTGTPSVQLGAPVLGIFGNNTDTQIGLQWAAIANATGYDIYRVVGGNQTKVGTTTALNYLNTGLTPSTQYTHYIKAITNIQGYTDSTFSNPLTTATAVATGLPTPVAPTLTYNATDRTEVANHTTYPNGMEYSVNTGSTWAVYTAGFAYPVGDNAVPANTLQWRVKASSQNNVGVPVGNVAIAAKDNSVPAVSLTTPVEAVNMVWNPDTHSLAYDANGGNAERTRFREYIPSDQDGYVQGILGGIQLLLDDLPGDFNNNPLFRINKNPVNNMVQAASRNGSDTTYHDMGTVSGAVVGRISLIGSNVLFQYSTDNGASFIGNYTIPRTAGINAYVKAKDGGLGNTLGDMKGGGLLLNTLLT